MSSPCPCRGCVKAYKQALHDAQQAIMQAEYGCEHHIWDAAILAVKELEEST